MARHCVPVGSLIIRIVFAIAGIALLAVSNAAQAKEPRVPPGPATPDAVTIALIGPGVDYRDYQLKGRLARDGEGQLISWDTVDSDNRPFETRPDLFGTKSAIMLALLAPDALLVIAREARGQPRAFLPAMQFVARTPARIVVWADPSPRRPDWPIFAEAVNRFRDRLFVLAAGDEGQNLDRSRAFDTIRGAANLLVVASRGRSKSPNVGRRTIDLTIVENSPDELANSWQAALVAAGLAARLLHQNRKSTPADLKRLITSPPPKGIAKVRGLWQQFDAIKALRER